MDAFSRLLNTMSTAKTPDKKEVRIAYTLEAYDLRSHASALLGNSSVSNFPHVIWHLRHAWTRM